jgi:membrane fusion protein (multidrug efflux system)
MTKRMIIMLLLVLLVLGGVFGYKAFTGIMMGKYFASLGAPVSTVSSIKVVATDWQPKLEAVGSLRAVNGADLASEVSGIVESLHFESGGNVEKEAVLVQLRADDDIAKLKSLEAAAKLSSLTFERSKKLITIQAISQASFDTDQAAFQGAEALVVQQKALVAKKTIHAPFEGQVGIRQVDVGQYLQPGTPVVTLQQLSPIYVDFNLPEVAVSKVRVGQKVNAHLDSIPGQTFEGNITAVNAKVDEATRNIQVRASFANEDHKMLPGMFASVEIDTGAPEKYLTLPQSAITFNPYGNVVYVVDAADPNGSKKLVAKQVFVTTGARRGDQIAILTGLKEGDEVVTSGQIKLRQGAPIAISNKVTPTNDADPKPVDK